ncbi:Uncharacterised protein [Burkholderia pseudomallei]|nr:Uncharacterised protein [Burkholderia pseudomallei]CAJ3489856.1 Uncharacterised protein [Burkholderia pseudomallei]CAJ3545440.1 Uncharacterised protein [Burkholderia pseudomallei]CAJ3602471.1 Uncharacterised protein [Burkholderia pseudomallei]CAJ3953036.1 Uncharacterised protein [Burkholderia pseudomallei]
MSLHVSVSSVALPVLVTVAGVRAAVRFLEFFRVGDP